MKKSIIYLTISAALTFSGCDYLDDMPYDWAQPDDIFTNEQNYLISDFVSTIYNIPPRKMQEGIFLFAAKNGTFCRNSTRRNGLLYPRRADRAARGQPPMGNITTEAAAAPGRPRRRC